jgi:hypothetical protein
MTALPIAQAVISEISMGERRLLFAELFAERYISGQEA